MRWNHNNYHSFTEKDIQNRDLVINMLKYENDIIHSDVGKSIYENEAYELFSSLETMFVIHRITLNAFGFTTTDSDVNNYRKIFSYYYKSPTEYDKQVLDSVTYMRENKCVYYTAKDFNVGDTFEDTQVYDLSGKNKVNISSKINSEDEYTFIGAFSNS